LSAAEVVIQLKEAVGLWMSAVSVARRWRTARLWDSGSRCADQTQSANVVLAAARFLMTSAVVLPALSDFCFIFAVPVANQIEYIGDASHPGLEGEEHALLSEPCAIRAHPCPTIGACASHYSSSCKTAARDEDAARRGQQHDQGIPAGSNRSAVQHMRFAMASAATSVDHECPWIELFE
jgi:hypothetical protein